VILTRKGANLSGDLQKPHKAIPVGTMISTILCYLTYLLLSYLFGFTTSGSVLASDFNIGGKVSFVYWLYIVGVFANTAAAGISSFIGAARVLQAMGKDELIPKTKWIGCGCGKNDEPLVAALITFVLTQCLLFMGQLNSIAPLVTLSFVLSYALTNLAGYFSVLIF
jgi:amino acid transporter